MRVSLMAVHCRFDVIPAAVSQQAAFDLVILCDKYDMVGLLKPFWHRWVRNLPRTTGDPTSFVHRLWIAHTLGYEECYNVTLMDLMSLLRTDDKDRIFLGNYEEDLGENIHLRHLGVVGKWRSRATLTLN